MEDKEIFKRLSVSSKKVIDNMIEIENFINQIENNEYREELSLYKQIDSINAMLYWISERSEELSK